MREGEGTERERGREGERSVIVWAEPKLHECLLVDGGLVHGENW